MYRRMNRALKDRLLHTLVGSLVWCIRRGVSMADQRRVSDFEGGLKACILVRSRFIKGRAGGVVELRLTMALASRPTKSYSKLQLRTFSLTDLQDNSIPVIYSELRFQSSHSKPYFAYPTSAHLIYVQPCNTSTPQKESATVYLIGGTIF